MEYDTWHDNDDVPISQSEPGTKENPISEHQCTTGKVTNESGWIKVVKQPKRKQAEITPCAVIEQPWIKARTKAILLVLTKLAHWFK